MKDVTKYLKKNLDLFRNLKNLMVIICNNLLYIIKIKIVKFFLIYCT